MGGLVRVVSTLSVGPLSLSCVRRAFLVACLARRLRCPCVCLGCNSYQKLTVSARHAGAARHVGAARGGRTSATATRYKVTEGAGPGQLPTDRGLRALAAAAEHTWQNTALGAPLLPALRGSKGTLRKAPGMFLGYLYLPSSYTIGIGLQ